ncbi:RNA ligase family protein [Candidatus Uabimicrobium amorphum]|uniref:RNA ligase (ATP) n=1 Tax=Uabimicrobium amorphum TaxID=2596890 RepID=A0A5S9ITJ1_UABAM|nr:RNA ligase family protein [Candidatus Uabimicrobium amorphum]BBM86880.1 hypothetical protein UABAM_05282 [Candidatus Uabimicrobium amorphum]
MEFKHYKSIQNTSSQKYINKLVTQRRTSGSFIVQEKIHGANFSLWCDGKEVKYGRRKGFTEKGDFYDYSAIQQDCQEKVTRLYNILQEKGITQVAVFGELFGGFYPHPSTTEDKEVPIIQQKIYYSPHLQFCAFDILADEQFISVRESNKLFAEVGFFYAKTLFSGSFEECMKYPNFFPTTIPASLGLPEMEDNICEGVIIRSDDRSFFSTFQRVVLKNKNERWEEKKIVKVDEVDLSEEANTLLGELLSCVTANRLRNVISKIEQISENSFGTLMKELSRDVWDEFNKTYQLDFEKLDKFSQKKLRKQTNTACAALITENFTDIVANKF